MSFGGRLGTGRLRQVAIYFGAAEPPPEEERRRAEEPPSWRYRFVVSLVIAGILGLVVGLRRSTDSGLVCTFIVVAALAGVALVDSRRHGLAERRPVVAEFGTTFLFQASFFGSLHAAWNDDQSIAGSVAAGVAFGIAMGAFRAYETRNHRRDTIEPRDAFRP